MSPASPAHKPAVAVYTRYFLSPSETFVYRQLQGVSGAFRPIVLTAELRNRHLYPFEPVYECRRHPGEKGLIYLARMLTGRYTMLSRAQKSAWRRALVDHSVRLVHAHFGNYGLDMLELTRDLGIPLVVTFHGFDASSLLRVKSYARELRELFRYAHVVTVSGDMARRLDPFGVDHSSLDVHYIGVPVENFDFVERIPVAKKIADAKPLHFVQVSNFVEKKGHRYTIEAFARYFSRHDGHVLTLAGDGPWKAPAEALCRARGIAERVRFPGMLVPAEVSELMRDADVFVHHSVTTASGEMEGIPTVMMEAMSRGLVVISTLHSGIPELVADKQEGYLVAERDVDAYVECLESLGRTDPGMPARARARIEASFDIHRQNEILVDIYRKAIDGRRP